MSTALVTGASSGIGLAAARALKKAGYTVIGTSRDPDAASVRVPEFDFLRLDMTEESSVKALCDSLPPLDLLVNNAGASLMSALEETPLLTIRRLYELLFFGNIQLIQGILPGMRARGGGLIINIGSLTEYTPAPGTSVYASAKAALHALSTALRQELGPFGIRVATVAPSYIHTPITQERLIYDNSPYMGLIRDSGVARDAGIESGSPPEEIARVIVKIAGKRHPASFYAAGKNARLLSAAHRFLPETLREAAIRRKFSKQKGR